MDPNVFKRLADPTVIYATGFKDYIFRRKVYRRPIVHRFETTDAPLPERYDELLTSIFGDYMTPPPEEDRKGAGGFPCGAYKDYIMEQKKRHTAE